MTIDQMSNTVKEHSKHYYRQLPMETLDVYVTQNQEFINGLEDKIGSVIDDLETSALSLRKLCHVEGCPEPTGCPHFHDECFKGLSIFTACIWEIADIITHRWAQFYDTGETDKAIENCKHTAFEVGTVHSILARNHATLTYLKDRQRNDGIDAKRTIEARNRLDDVLAIVEKIQSDNVTLKIHYSDLETVSSDLEFFLNVRAEKQHVLSNV